MFFDNSKFFAFVDACRKAGITVPIIPGLKPLSSKSQLSILPHHFHIDLPQALVDDALKAKCKEEIEEVGTAWCIQQSKELKEAGVPCLHYYTMGKAETIAKIATAVF